MRAGTSSVRPPRTPGATGSGGGGLKHRCRTPQGPSCGEQDQYNGLGPVQMAHSVQGKAESPVATKMAARRPRHFSSRETGSSQSGCIWQGDTPTMSARVTRQACLQSGATHREHPGEIPHSPSGVPRHLPKRPRRVESITFQVQLRQAQTTAETAEPHAPECAPRHAGLRWHWPPKALPHCPLPLQTCPGRTPMTPSAATPPCAWTRRLRLQDSGSLSHTDGCVSCFPWAVKSVSRTLMYVDALL